MKDCLVKLAYLLFAFDLVTLLQQGLRAMCVKTCDRNGCNNIMCDRMSHEHGYICSECFDELVESGSETVVADFMNSKKKRPINKNSAFARFDLEFPSNYVWI